MSAAPLELPELFHVADGTAVVAQRRYFRALSAVGVCSVTAALAGGLQLAWRGTDWGALAVVLAFGVQCVVLVLLAHARYDQVWYEARAAAESLRTLAWRFAVCGEPFPAGAVNPVAALALRSSEILREMEGELRVLARGGQGPAVPPSLLAVRAADQPERQRLYLEQRLGDQQDWYRRKAEQHARSARRLLGLVLLVSVAGVVLGLVRAVSTVPLGLDVAGLCAAASGAVLAHLQARQSSVLARAYHLTGLELALLRDTAPTSGAEDEWADWVGHAEEAISREHTMWLASRGRPSRLPVRGQPAPR